MNSTFLNEQKNSVNQERVVQVMNGWTMLPITVVAFVACPTFLVTTLAIASGGELPVAWLLTGIFLSAISLIIATTLTIGFFTLQPNEAQILILFGAYKGTVRASGFHWANPFYSKSGISTPPAAENANRPTKPGTMVRKNRISLRSRTFNGERLKVNDKRGNPIEIATVIIWRVQDTAQATFDVDDYEKYVATQTESALRHMASCFAYDHGEDHEVTLLNGVTEVSQALRTELQERLAKAGLVVEEARLTHLAYAPEIAQAMLRRQQAEAVIAARQKIVQGAVSMVDMALRELAHKQVVNLDDERKAAMVSNLMVVLCGEAEVHPVVNAGTLYN